MHLCGWVVNIRKAHFLLTDSCIKIASLFPTMIKYFIICASKEHVLKGKERGFAQVDHGKKEFISKPVKDDWIIYYSSKDKLEDGKPLQKFTAIGNILDVESYQPETHSNFKPFRRKAHYFENREADIRPLTDKLNFIKNKKKWGFYLISGFREINKDDFNVIKNAMMME